MSFNGLKNLQKKMSEMKSEQSVPLTELLTPKFIVSCSSFKNAQELFDKSGFKIDSPNDFAAIPEDAWDKYIAQKTTYKSWSEMLQAATIAWTKKKIGL